MKCKMKKMKKKIIFPDNANKGHSSTDTDGVPCNRLLDSLPKKMLEKC